MASWRHSLKQIFTQGLVSAFLTPISFNKVLFFDRSADDSSLLSPPSSFSARSARRRSLLDLLGGSGGDDGAKRLSITGAANADPVATGDDDAVRILSLQSREDGEEEGGPGGEVVGLLTPLDEKQ